VVWLEPNHSGGAILIAVIGRRYEFGLTAHLITCRQLENQIEVSPAYRTGAVKTTPVRHSGRDHVVTPGASILESRHVVELRITAEEEQIGLDVTQRGEDGFIFH
jgi:hypothetical protein